MIPNDPDALKKMRELAERNIANGDWGDEVVFPGETVALSPEERNSKSFITHMLSKLEGRRLPKRNP